MNKLAFSILVLTAFFFAACGGGNQGTESTETGTDNTTETVIEEDDPMDNKGIGPITAVTLGEIDTALVSEGKALFKTNCKTCHKVDKRFVGPAIAGLIERRSPEWIMNMMLNPEVMVEEDPIAMTLLAEYLSPMANQSLTEEEARAILEYFRTL